MKTRETTPGKTYSVHTSSGCTVSDKNGWSKTIDAPDGYFTAHAGEVTIDGDDAADIREVFKLAPQQQLAILGVLGGNAGGLPAGYKRVEHLESTGKQYIKTGYFSNADKIGLKSEAEQTISSAGASLGCGDDISMTLIVPRVKVDSTVNWGYGWKAWVWKANSGYLFNTQSRRVIGELNFLQSGKMLAYIEGKLWAQATLGEPPVGSLEITMFAINEPDGPFCDYTKVWAASISDGDKIVRDFVPCLDKTGAPCMFDLVTRKAFYNSGAGDFLYPTDSTTYSLRRVLPDWGKLTEHGLRRLYHAPANYKGELYDYALENGYKPIIEPEQPEEGYWAPRWTETADEIVLEWVESEPPTDEFGLPDEPLTETE